MEEVLRGIDEIECYIDDIVVLTDSWARHMAVLEEVLTRLENNGFTINPLKCEWAVNSFPVKVAYMRPRKLVYVLHH